MTARDSTNQPLYTFVAIELQNASAPLPWQVGGLKTAEFLLLGITKYLTRRKEIIPKMKGVGRSLATWNCFASRAGELYFKNIRIRADRIGE